MVNRGKHSPIRQYQKKGDYVVGKMTYATVVESEHESAK
jgi:hypothetical protein